MVDDLVVHDTRVKVPERGDCAGLDDGSLRIVTGEVPDRTHRGPSTDHGELDHVVKFPPNEIGTEEPFDASQVRRDDVSKVLRIGIWPVDVTPMTTAHRCRPPVAWNHLLGLVQGIRATAR